MRVAREMKIGGLTRGEKIQPGLIRCMDRVQTNQMTQVSLCLAMLAMRVTGSDVKS